MKIQFWEAKLLIASQLFWERKKNCPMFENPALGRDVRIPTVVVSGWRRVVGGGVVVCEKSVQILKIQPVNARLASKFLWRGERGGVKKKCPIFQKPTL